MAELHNNLANLLRKYYKLSPDQSLPSQQKIANDFGVSQTTASRWLNDKIDRFDADVLAKFCRKLKCNIGDLVYFDMQELLEK